MENFEYDKTKVYVIEVSNYCINKCDGCIYTIKQRQKNFFMDYKDFELILDFIKEYSDKNNSIPHILLGTGEVLNEFTIDYIEMIEKVFGNKEKTIEIATTGRVEDFEKIIDDINSKILSNTHVIIEFVLDGMTKSPEQQSLINKNINYCIETGTDLHAVLKTSVNYLSNKNKIIENLKFYNLKKIALDYVFIKDTKKLIDFKDISNFFINFDKELKEKTNMEIVNYISDLSDFTENQNYLYSNFSFYITFNLDIDILLGVPFGDLIINKTNSDYHLNLNIKNNKNIICNKIKTMENNIYIQNKINSESINLCNSCFHKKSCCIFLVKKVMERNNIEFNNDCLGGFKILKYFKERN